MKKSNAKSHKSFEFRESPNEKCAVVGIFNVNRSAALCYYALFAMQHRGQESSGISTTDGRKITTIKGEGLVTSIFKGGLDALKGSASIGHNRYSTAGEDSKCDVQPIFAKYALGEIALAHNGNLVNAKEVRKSLTAKGAIFQSHLDTENLIHLIAHSKKERLRDRIIESLQHIKGAYSFVLLSRGKLFAIRDPFGFRPLSLGEITNDDGSKGYIVASETCAFDLIGARFVRDINPGEMVIFSLKSVNSSLTQNSGIAENFKNPSLRESKATEAIHESKIDCHDLAFAKSRNDKNINSIRGIDPSTEMLKIAQQKLPQSVILQNGEAKDLHIDSQSVDILSIAYGLRNVVEIDLALKEFHRVLRKNGILVILEFSKKDNENIFDKIARFYTKRILPYLGGFISKNYAAYKYLPDSVDDFLSLEQIATKLRTLGFNINISKRYFCNVCSLIIAKKDY